MKFSGVKKISAAAIAAMMLVAGMTACGSSDSTGTADSGATTGTDVKKIGIIQLVEHDSLDLAREGFIDGLAEAGYVDGQNIKIDYKNAQGDIPNCTTIAGQFANDNKDLVLAVATQAAQSNSCKTVFPYFSTICTITLIKELNISVSSFNCSFFSSVF